MTGLKEKNCGMLGLDKMPGSGFKDFRQWETGLNNTFGIHETQSPEKPGGVQRRCSDSIFSKIIILLSRIFRCAVLFPDTS